MSATESKGKSQTIGILIALLALAGIGVGAALLLTKDKDKADLQKQTKDEQAVVAPVTRLVEEPPPIPEALPTVETPVPEPVPVPEDTEVKPKKKAIPIGTIDIKAAQAVTKQNYTKVRACYEKQLKVNALLQGNVKVKITIFPDGNVSSVQFVQDTMHNSTMNQCIKNEILSWQFPKPDGGKVEINQSYRLEPKAG